MLKLFKKKKSTENCNFNLLSSLIKDILSENQNIKLTHDTRFEDIGFDSMKFINLLLSLEDIKNISIENIVEEIDMTELETIGDVVNVLDRF